MSEIKMRIGDQRFRGRLERATAPRACALFLARLPYAAHLIHARWSGEACWIPIGGPVSDLGQDLTTHTPRPGQVLYYAGGAGEPEILVPYGVTRFACTAGPLAGGHVLTIVEGLDRLATVGREILLGGAQPIGFALS
jgi:hypothetical protein